jgi:hypothetical protein
MNLQMVSMGAATSQRRMNIWYKDQSFTAGILARKMKNPAIRKA